MEKNKNITSAQQRKYLIFFIASFILIGFLIYSNCFHCPFEFDDIYSIVTNDAIKQNSTFTQFNAQRYIGLITFALNYKINNLNPFGYHLVNVIIHLLNALLVFFFVRNLFVLMEKNGSPSINNFIMPYLIALIFLVHPIQTQAVTYITQRFTSLAALFTFASLLFYIKFRTEDRGSFWYFIISIVSALLAYKTKENTAILPLIIILVEYMCFKTSKITWKRKMLYALPFFLLLIFLVISFIDVSMLLKANPIKTIEAAKETTSMTRVQYLMTEQRVILTYIRLLLFPINQSVDYYYPLSASFFEARTFFSFITILLLLAIAIILFKKLPLVSFGILWFFIFLLVESTVIPITDVIFEHRVYLPSVGFILAFVCIIRSMLKAIKLKGFAIVFILISLILSIATYARNEVWKDGISLWKDAATKFPENMRCHLNLGHAYAENKLYDDAIRELQIGLANDPNDALAHHVVGFCYWKKGIGELAEKEMALAIQLDPRQIDYYSSLATVYFDHQNYRAAFAVLQKAQSIDSTNPIINAQLGRAYCGLGNLNQALFYYEEAIKLNVTKPDVYYDRGLCYLYFNKFTESRADFLKVIELVQTNYDSYFFVGLTYEMERNFIQASQFYNTFLSMVPKDYPLYKEALAHLRKVK